MDTVVAELGLVCYAAILKPQLINTDRLSDSPWGHTAIKQEPCNFLTECSFPPLMVPLPFPTPHGVQKLDGPR